MSNKELPDERGHFGPYGGMFVADTLVHALQELNDAYSKYRTDPEFIAELQTE
ncbi:MAG: tryptophan synthase subunit beta, partial [Legionella sp.]